MSKWNVFALVCVAWALSGEISLHLGLKLGRAEQKKWDDAYYQSHPIYDLSQCPAGLVKCSSGAPFVAPPAPQPKAEGFKIENCIGCGENAPPMRSNLSQPKTSKRKVSHNDYVIAKCPSSGDWPGCVEGCPLVGGIYCPWLAAGKPYEPPAYCKNPDTWKPDCVKIWQYGQPEAKACYSDGVRTECMPAPVIQQMDMWPESEGHLHIYKDNKDMTCSSWIENGPAAGKPSPCKKTQLLLDGKCWTVAITEDYLDLFGSTGKISTRTLQPGVLYQGDNGECPRGYQPVNWASTTFVYAYCYPPKEAQ
jgi:hypothetical protein